MTESLHAECAHAIVRCIAVAACAALLGRFLSASLRGGTKHRTAAWLLLLAPCLTPPLLAAYAYAGFAHSVLHRPVLKELVYGLLLLFRLVPVAVVAYACVPRVVSREAVYCHRLSRPRGLALPHRIAHARLLLHGEPGAGLVAGALVFLLAFAEFEQASLLSATHWTVALFDAQAGGRSLAESLRLAAVPVACGLLALLPALCVLRGMLSKGAPLYLAPTPPRGAAWMWGYLAVALTGGVVLPSGVMLRGTFEGLTAFLKGFSLQREMAAGLGVAVAAAAGTYLVAGLATRPLRGLWRSLHGSLIASACIPGLLGALVLALGLQFLFQLPAVRTVYDTPVPLLTGLMLYLFPFAVLLSRALDTGPFNAASQVARLLERSPHAAVRNAGNTLLWRLHYRRQFWLFGLLFCLAYFDVTLASILAPTGLPSATSRLYNFMHYGRSAVLSAMLCCTVLAAAAAMAGIYAAGREGVRRYG